MEFQKTRHLLSAVRRGVEQYQMIEEGDRIAVGVSGGKDSLALLVALSELRRFYPKQFTLHAISVDMGIAGMDFSPIAEFCKAMDVPFTCVQTEIYKIIFEVRKEANPCSLCAKMRRGILHDSAKAAGCNKIALGHHFDDAVETFVMNLIHEGRIDCFSPVTYLSRKDITMIRPMVFATEKDVAYFARNNALPVIENLCPNDGHSQREAVKQLLYDGEKRYPGLRHRLFGAMERGDVGGFGNPTGYSQNGEQPPTEA